MGKVAKKNPRYRTKDEIVRDLVSVLSASLSYGTKWAVMKDVAWVWTEFHGKYKGCQYWTKTALALHQREPKAKLRHEHVVPKVVVMKMLSDLKSPTSEQVREICERFLIGVVVTREEDALLNVEYRQSMPDEFFDSASPSYLDPWLRYKKCNIEVVPGGQASVPTEDAPSATTEETSTAVERAPVEVSVKRNVVSPNVVTDPALLIRINRLYRDGMSAAELYEATRGWWRIGSRREGARLALAVFDGIVREVYRIDRWHPAGSTPPAAPVHTGSPRPGRWEFTGAVALPEERDRYRGQSVAAYFTKGMQSPFLYVNC